MAVPQQLSPSSPAATSAISDCDREEMRIESWLDEHPGFFQNYLIRKGNRGMIDAWLVSHALPPGMIRPTSTENFESSSGQNHVTAKRETSASGRSTSAPASTPGSASKASRDGFISRI